jgi:GDP-fucose transporter C1
VFLHQPTTPPVLLSCIIIFLGFLSGLVYEQQVEISTLGILFGVLSSVTTASHAIIIKTSFGKVAGGNTLDLVYYNNVLSGMLLTPIWLLSGESGDVLELLKVWWNLSPGQTLVLTGGTLSQFFSGVFLTVSCHYEAS